MGEDSCLGGHGFEPRRRILDGHFFTLFCCKNYLCEKTENNRTKDEKQQVSRRVILHLNPMLSFICYQTGFKPVSFVFQAGEASCQMVGKPGDGERRAEWRTSEGRELPACLPGCRTRFFLNGPFPASFCSFLHSNSNDKYPI